MERVKVLVLAVAIVLATVCSVSSAHAQCGPGGCSLRSRVHVELSGNVRTRVGGFGRRVGKAVWLGLTTPVRLVRGGCASCG